jgi:hypothetical protein
MHGAIRVVARRAYYAKGDYLHPLNEDWKLRLACS